MKNRKNELGEQTHVIKSIRRDGGYGRKISHRFIVGIPDLLLVVPGYVPGIWEMKDLSDWEKNTERQLEVTDKQGIELFEFEKACNSGPQGSYNPPIFHKACGVLVTYKTRGTRFLMICHNEVRHVRKGMFPTIAREQGPYYNMQVLFSSFGVAKWPNL